MKMDCHIIDLVPLLCPAISHDWDLFFSFSCNGPQEINVCVVKCKAIILWKENTAMVEEKLIGME